jgi:hypothetical protein
MRWLNFLCLMKPVIPGTGGIKDEVITMTSPPQHTDAIPWLIIQKLAVSKCMLSYKEYNILIGDFDVGENSNG